MTGEGRSPPDGIWPDLLGGLAVIGGMIVMLVTLPLTLPIALVFDWNGRRRLRAAATVTPCGRCGTLLGPDALVASDAAHMAELVEAQRCHPLHHVHVARRAQARCRACGADHVWDGKRRTLHLLVDAARDHRDQAAKQAEEERRCKDC